MRVRVLSWNLRWNAAKRFRDPQQEFIASHEWDVLCLQEVTPDDYDALVDTGISESDAFPGNLIGKFGSAVLTRGDFRIERPALLAEMPMPERAVFATVIGTDGTFELCSWHAPNAGNPRDRWTKRAGYMAMNRWVCARRGPLIVGADANHGSLHTSTDYPGDDYKPYPDNAWSEENRFWSDPRERDHDLVDTWMRHLEQNPELTERLRKASPEGPSAVSYIRGSGSRQVPDRFDYILASPEFTVVDAAYHYEPAREAGSDHAAVWAELELRASPSEGGHGTR